jgi:uncharacterized protein YndB with AHSA1/START domain
MAARTGSARQPAEENLVISRVIEAPRRRVFEAWTKPEQLVRWWGPITFTTPFCNIDLRTGGAFHYCMRSPEGRDYWGKGVYREIVEPERIVYTDSFSDEDGNLVQPAKYGMSPDWPPETLVTVTLAEHDGETQLTVQHGVPESVADSAGARQGWTESLDRLADYVAKG